MRISFLIDGFNLYGSIVDLKRLHGLKVKWLDINSLFHSYLHHFGKEAVIEEIHYFTALQHYATKDDPHKVARHVSYIKCLEDTGILVHYGRFKQKKMYCRNCRTSYIKWEEKETDVSIGVKLLDIAIEDSADAIIIVSGDTDLVPAVKTCQKQFPELEIGFFFPFNRKRKELSALTTSEEISMKGKQYRNHQYSDPYTLKGGNTVVKPHGW